MIYIDSNKKKSFGNRLSFAVDAKSVMQFGLTKFDSVSQKKVKSFEKDIDNTKTDQ